MMAINMKSEMERKMITKTYQKVFSVNGRLQAAIIQKSLEMAGLQVDLQASRNGAYLDIFVPREKVYDARNLFRMYGGLI